MINYRPHKNGFPLKFLVYLYNHGRSDGITIQEAIGLNEWADRKGLMYFSRASINFDSINMMLEEKGLVVRLANDYYELTEEGEEFMRNYNPR